MKEQCKLSKNGQWSLEKWNMEKRCWEGYEPTPGKKPYDEGSCQPVKKDEADNTEVSIAPEGSNNRKTYLEEFGKSDIEISFFDNGEAEVLFGQDVPYSYEQDICSTLLRKCYEEVSKKDWSPKAEHKSDKGGLTEAGRKSYNRATGGNLKAPQPGGGPRKRSFCARNKGQIEMHGIDCKKDPEKRACKARRRWKCTN
jgi:hypothetical protein